MGHCVCICMPHMKSPASTMWAWLLYTYNDKNNDDSERLHLHRVHCPIGQINHKNTVFPSSKEAKQRVKSAHFLDHSVRCARQEMRTKCSTCPHQVWDKQDLGRSCTGIKTKNPIPLVWGSKFWGISWIGERTKTKCPTSIQPPHYLGRYVLEQIWDRN